MGMMTRSEISTRFIHELGKRPETVSVQDFVLENYDAAFLAWLENLNPAALNAMLTMPVMEKHIRKCYLHYEQYQVVETHRDIIHSIAEAVNKVF